MCTFSVLPVDVCDVIALLNSFAEISFPNKNYVQLGAYSFLSFTEVDSDTCASLICYNIQNIGRELDDCRNRDKHE